MVESRQEECLSIIGIFTVLAFIFVTLRVYSRYLGRNFGWDDHLIIIAMVILLGQTIAMWEYVLRSGTGFHTWDIPKKPIHKQVTTNHFNFAVQMLYHPILGLVRASIIVFLWRMKDNRKRIRYSLHVVWWLNIMYAVSTTVVNVVQCSPVQYAWNRPAMDTIDFDGNLIKGGKCIDSRTFILSSCALSIFMDLIIIPIPSIMVWNLQMDRKTKILIVVVMSLGWIATAVSIARFIVYYYRFAPTMPDRTWDIGLSISIAEPAVHIMTACAPATKCLFRSLFPYFARSRGRTRTDTTYLTDGVSGNGTVGQFSFGFGAKDWSGVEEIGLAVADGKGGVGRKRASSTLDSRESVREVVAKDGKSSIGEAEPQHCLGLAK